MSQGIFQSCNKGNFYNNIVCFVELNNNNIILHQINFSSAKSPILTFFLLRFPPKFVRQYWGKNDEIKFRQYLNVIALTAQASHYMLWKDMDLRKKQIHHLLVIGEKRLIMTLSKLCAILKTRTGHEWLF